MQVRATAAPAATTPSLHLYQPLRVNLNMGSTFLRTKQTQGQQQDLPG
jgi:hypothetical protein